uniref:protein-disulfide reductase DsbD family protein n=1 Tax=Zunongwangia profunda TaxID=398743 RepID=UPI0030DAC6E6
MGNTVKSFFLFLILFCRAVVEAQVADPIKWTTETEKISDTEYLLIAKAALDTGWHLYAQQVPDEGPVPTSFIYDDSSGNFRIVGNTQEEEGKIIYDPVFEMEVKYFENSAIFKQKIEVTKELGDILALVEYMVCDDTRCLPPEEEELTFNLTEETIAETSKGSVRAVDSTSPEAEDSGSESRGLITIFFLSFLGGFAALLTPCVFPMIPMTVSFFTKQSKTRASGIKNALLYGLFIIVIYVVLGSVVTAIFGADSLNALSTNVVFNLIFFALLIFFACSFLGAFELVLPSSWATKIDSQTDRGGLIGIFFMALALAIVSFSCTGPIVGTLLVEAASKGGLAPIIGMLGFSLAIALP